MGQVLAKPENPFVRDHVRLCDGLAPLTGADVAAAGSGRFVFRLGDFKWTNQPDETRVLIITLDYIDLLLLTRVRLTLGPFYDFGSLSAFYALDERTIVLVDVNVGEETVRQRLISIDPEKATSHAFLDRCYELDTRGERPSYCSSGQSAVSEDRVMTTATLTSFDPYTSTPVAIVYPKDPFNREMRVDDLTEVLEEANNRLFREVDSAEYQFRLSKYVAPFFLSPTKVGLIVQRHDIRASQQFELPDSQLALEDVLYVDQSYVVVYDLLEDDISIERIRPDPVTNFPYNHEQKLPHQSLIASGCMKELCLLITDRHSARGWHVMTALLYETIAKCMLCISHSFDSVSGCFINLRSFLHEISWKVKDMRKVRFGLLDTKTLQWREQQGVTDQIEFDMNGKIRLSAFPDGHFLIYQRDSETRGATRVIGNNSSNSKEPKEELRVLSNPRKCYSLKTLAEMELRKRPIARLAILQVAARIHS